MSKPDNKDVPFFGVSADEAERTGVDHTSSVDAPGWGEDAEAIASAHGLGTLGTLPEDFELDVQQRLDVFEARLVLVQKRQLRLRRLVAVALWGLVAVTIYLSSH